VHALGLLVGREDGTVDPPGASLVGCIGTRHWIERDHGERSDHGASREHNVKFGIFYEHQLPRPWGETSERQLIADALDQIERADQLGVQYLWEVEHHFLEEYSHSSAPEVFLAAASQRTSRMRIGHGVVQTAPGYNHPARIAERIAMLDLVSNGRVEFGSGESSSEAELAGFGIDRDSKRAAWLEGLEVAIRCMTETPFGGVDGEFVTMPPRNVVPKPVQKPHPPLWVACSRRDTILLAAEMGIGALSFAFVEPEDARQWVVDYKSVFTERAVPVGLAANPQVACVTPMMCAEREEDALARGLEGANFFGYSLAHFYVFGDHVPATTDVWAEFLERRGKMGYSPEAALAARHETLGAKAASGDQTGLRGAIGTPAQLREFLRRYEDAGIAQLIFVMQAGKNRHEDIMESIELFGTQVLPEFIERDEAASQAKAAAWEPHIEEAMSRRQRSDPVMPEEYVMRAIPKQMVEAMASEPAQQWLDQLADKQAAGVHDEEFQRLVDG
jgi:alkanesulfonate monooxygenase SsuD/methylene tetrahydromethanopterin reductase-like flavin-dependent oxidoreductase (luciferase family)